MKLLFLQQRSNKILYNKDLTKYYTTKSNEVYLEIYFYSYNEVAILTTKNLTKT